MKVGRFEIEYLSEGFFEILPGNVFSKVKAASITGKEDADADMKTMVPVTGINPVLLRNGKYNILLDCGLGWGLDSKSKFTDTSNIKTNLDIFGLVPHDISHVVLTHLHYDHAAGATFSDASNITKPTMAFAEYVVQKEEWLYAVSQMTQPVNAADNPYNLDEMYRLYSEGKFKMIHNPVYNLVPGVQLIRTGGHTPGHQIVRIHDQGETAYFLGGLIPEESALNEFYYPDTDTNPLQAKKARISLLRQAFEEKALLLFYHSRYARHGYLDKDARFQYILREL